MLFLLFFLFEFFGSSSSEDCGPLGYKAQTLLGPAYWFVDISQKDCPPMKPDVVPLRNVSDEKICRLYFNPCQSQTYQCAGTVCLRYLKTVDYVLLLGKYKYEPFIEGDNSFQVTYTGEKVNCEVGLSEIITSIHFKCNNNSIWQMNKTGSHGGVEAPNPTNIFFDKKSCKYDIYFDSSEACAVIPKGDSPAHSISTGSLMLILFVPGVLLYFILGCLFNKMRGHSGVDLIPHRKFWIDLPDLIMDGFTFTMATITCRHEDRNLRDYEQVID